MTRRTYTPKQKKAALKKLKELNGNLAEAAKEIGMPKQTLHNWAEAAEVDTSGDKKTEAATEAKKIDIEARKANLADELMDSIIKLNAQMFQPHIVFSFGGKDNTFNSKTLDEPTTGDKKNLATSLAILIDKVQLLTGAATSRNEDRQVVEVRDHAESLIDRFKDKKQRDELAERRKAKAANG
ncbi:transposase [Kocuria rosea]|uniref:transposase n=1 Tax=Kocuria rosea TaxID=1275 RepID=UPI0011A04F87|nr:transposase [Kocuria rosea]